MNNFHTKWAKRTAAKIQAETLTEADIRYLRKRFAAVEDGDTRYCSLADLEALDELIRNTKPRVSDEQARKGADWLYRMVYTPTGALRRTAFAAEFTARDRDVILALRENPHFTLNGLENVGTYRAAFVPVYNAIGPDSFFRYAAQAWQSGGQSFIIHHA